MSAGHSRDPALDELRLDRVRAQVAEVDAAAERFAVPVEGGSVVWRCWGQGDPLVLIHGGAGSWTHWIRNVLTLSRSRRVYAPDLPGFGESPCTPLPRTADAIADRLEASFSCLPDAPGTTAVAAFSFGGVVAGRWAARVTERVSSLTLLGAVGLGVPRADPPDFTRVDRTLPLAERWEAQRRNLGRMMLADAHAADDLALFVHDENTRNTRLRSRPISLMDLLADTLPALRCPIQLIWGRADALYHLDTDERENFALSLPSGLPAVFVEDAGHWVQFERAEAVHGLLAGTVFSASSGPTGVRSSTIGRSDYRRSIQ